MIAAHKCIIQSQQTCTSIMQDLVVKRIDEGLGLILEVPSEPAVTPGFVHISNVGDTKVDKLQQVGFGMNALLSNSLGFFQAYNTHVHFVKCMPSDGCHCTC